MSLPDIPQYAYALAVPGIKEQARNPLKKTSLPAQFVPGKRKIAINFRGQAETILERRFRSRRGCSSRRSCTDRQRQINEKRQKGCTKCTAIATFWVDFAEEPVVRDRGSVDARRRQRRVRAGHRRKSAAEGLYLARERKSVLCEELVERHPLGSVPDFRQAQAARSDTCPPCSPAGRTSRRSSRRRYIW
eukprot:3941505-Rhodomonas_salina.4